jgi:uncharacterized repeat protein (TIGR01451 family)
MPHTVTRRNTSWRLSSLTFLIGLLGLAVFAAAQMLPVAGRVKASASTGSTPRSGSGESAGSRGRLSESYGKLPLRFEANRGQVARDIRFLARGSGYSLLLKQEGAVLNLRRDAARRPVDVKDGGQLVGDGSAEPSDVGAARAACTLRFGLAGSNRSSRVVGVGELAGRSNYLVGADPRAWHIGVANYGKVRYEGVYKGIDLVYYGKEGLLEYDFVVSSWADPARIGLTFEGARASRVDEDGDLVLSAGDGDVRLRKPFAYQEVGGLRKEVPVSYVRGRRGLIRFRVGEYDRRLPLVIDPVLVYSSYLGGGLNDQGLAVAVDSAGSAYVAGLTASTNFSGTGAGSVQGSKGAFTDAFVLKLNPDGKTIAYATYIGGNGSDTAAGIAVDAAGNAYVTGYTFSTTFPVTAGALQGGKGSGNDAFVAKLNPTGSALVYSTFLGGGGNDQALSVALDVAGAAYVVGRTDSFNFAGAPGVTRAGSPAFSSTDGGASWAPSGSGLTASVVNDFAAAPSAPNTVYAGTNLGVYKSTDGGANWQLAGQSQPSTAPADALSVAVDPSNASVVYAANFDGVYKSTDGGATFIQKNSGLSGTPVNTLAVDPSSPSTLYAGTTFGVNKSTDGGDTWVFQVVANFNEPEFTKLVIDPAAPQTVYAATDRGMFKTTDGGAHWFTINRGLTTTFTPSVSSVALDLTQTSTLYAAVNADSVRVYKSTDGGANWTNSSSGLSVTSDGRTFTPLVNALLIDPASPSTVYAGTNGYGVFKSTDGGANWAASNAGLTNKLILTLGARAGSPAAVLAGASIGGDAFAAKLNPAGSQLEYLRLLGGSEDDGARSVSVGADGSAYLAGSTGSADFPTANPFQPSLLGGTDAFVTKLAPDGSTAYSTFLGGTSTENGGAVAVGPGGTAYVTGTTSSSDFPLANALQPAREPTSFSSAFVTRLAADGHSLTYSTYLGGNNFEQGLGIAVGGDGSAFVTGSTSSANFPIVNSSLPRGGFGDAFVMKINPGGSAILFSTAFGGSQNETGTGVALDGSGGIYVAGNTDSSNFPAVNAARGSYGGAGDAFIAKFGPGVDLAVSITDSPDPVAYGSDLTYNISLKNNGDTQATGVTLTDNLPAGAALVSAAASAGTCSGTGPVVCDLGALDGGATATVTVKVKPPATRTISNTASVTLNEPDASPSDNSATAGTTVDFADISVTKSVLVPTAAPGSKVIFLLGVTNKGGTASGTVTLTDNLPPEVTFLSCDSPHGACGGSGGARNVTFPSLAVGASEDAVIVATVNMSAPAGATVGNTAAVSAALPDPDASDNSASASFIVSATAVAQKSNGKIAFTGSGPTTRISVVNADGTGAGPLTAGLDSDRRAAWSPDGSKLAYRTTTHTGSLPSPENVVVVNADGTSKVTLTSNAAPLPFEDEGPTWSPSGDLVAFIGRDASVYVVRPDGTGPVRLINNAVRISGLDWSPDGTRFAFTKDGALFVMDADGSNQRQLTTRQNTANGQTTDSDPDWSPDGSKILFTRSSGDALVINPDGTGLTRPFNIQQMVGAAWSPDGTKVVYTLVNDIYVANLDGSGLPLKITSGSSPAWQPLPNANPTPPPPPAQTFTISGRVTKPDGSAGSSIVKLSGARTATLGTDENGNYTFVNLPRGGSYTVTPTNGFFSASFKTYSPGSRYVADLQGDVNGFDFVEKTAQYTLKGRVVNPQGQPLAGVTVSLILGGQRDTKTDADGMYSFPLFSGSENYTITAFFPGYSFDPIRVSPLAITGDTTVNFVGTPFANAHDIGGQVTDAAGNFIAGINVTLGGARSAVVKTDAGGSFAFVNLPAGQDYTVTPSTAEGFAFTPPQQTFNNLSFGSFGGFKATTAQPAAQFAAADVSVGENARAVELTVTRTGDASAAASVDFETADVTASERSDYIASFGTVRFAKGEASKSFRVLVTDDNLLEGERIFSVTLKNGSGVRVGPANVATVHINDDDASAAPENPVDFSQFFVRQHYADFLNREPDASGLAFWTNEIEQCGADAQCREVKRINVSAAFFLSIEFQQTGYLVYRLQQASFGAGVALKLKTFLKDTQEIGRNVVVGQGDWQAQLEANKQAFVGDFVLRPEFLTVYPTTLPPALFVDALNANTGGALTQAERDSLVSALASGATTRAGVLRAVAENVEFTRREKNRAFVLMQYFGYLRRGPSDPPDSDLSGWQFWLSKLEQFDGNFIEAEMVKAFISSDEYRKRFGK